jgi:hypothetical protein
MTSIAEAEAKLKEPESPALLEILRQYFEQRNAGAWSNKAKLNNLKDFTHLICVIQERKIVTLADFEAYMRAYQDKSNAMTAELKKKSARMQELSDLIRYADDFKRLAPLYEELNAIKFKKKREAFAAEHDSELRLFHLAKRKLDAAAPDHKIPLNDWKKELAELSESYAKESEELKPIRAELKELYKIKSKLDTILRQQKKELEQERN